jgi:hypothetical protein
MTSIFAAHPTLHALSRSGSFEMSQYHLAMGDGKKFAEKTVKLG